MSRFVPGLAIILLVTAALVAGCSAPRTSSQVMVFQSPNCGCCEPYKRYLKQQGFQVETTYVEDMVSIKEKYLIPPSMYSCHTVVMEDYFVEGHMPVEAIKLLLEKRPAIEGIALPGMPPGSPGMPGPKSGALKIYALSKGRVSELMTIY